MLLRDGTAFQLTKEQKEKYGHEFTYTVLDTDWRTEKTPEGRDKWVSNKKSIALTSRCIFEDGTRGILTYCDNVISHNPTTNQKTYSPTVLYELSKTHFMTVEGNNPELNYYLQNSQYMKGNNTTFNTSAVFQLFAGNGQSEDAIEEELTVSAIKTRILQERDMKKLFTLKEIITSNGWANQFRDNMNAKELAYQLSFYVTNKNTRDAMKKALNELDKNTNNSVQDAIDANILTFDAANKKWMLDENGKKRAICGVKFGVTPDAAVMNYFNNNPDEQKLLTNILKPIPA